MIADELFDLDDDVYLGQEDGDVDWSQDPAMGQTIIQDTLLADPPVVMMGATAVGSVAYAALVDPIIGKEETRDRLIMSGGALLHGAATWFAFRTMLSEKATPISKIAGAFIGTLGAFVTLGSILTAVAPSATLAEFRKARAAAKPQSIVKAASKPPQSIVKAATQLIAQSAGAKV